MPKSPLPARRIGLAIRNARTRARMTQRELAAVMGVQLSQVGDWERGAKAAGGENLLRIADATRSELLGLREPPELDLVRQHLANALETLRRLDEEP